MDDSEDDDSDEDDNEDLDALEVIGQKSNKRKCNKHWLPKSKAKVIKTGQISDSYSGSDSDDAISVVYPVSHPRTEKKKQKKKLARETKMKTVKKTDGGEIRIRSLTSNIYNQAHCCVFCKEVFTNISKHLKTHGKEEAVKEIVQFQGTKKEKQAKWNILRNKGDNEHNQRVLSEGDGEIILGRRTHGSVKLEDYGPCPGCFQWLKLDKTMYNHQKVCPSKIHDKHSKGELRMKSLIISGRQQSKASKSLINEVFPIMTNDEISAIAQNDVLIVCLGNNWLARNIGNQLRRKYYTSSRMREAARLLINAREILEKDVTMLELLNPENFDTVTKAALITASPSFDDEDDLKAPSTAVRLGYEIKRMLNFKWAEGIKSNNEQTIKDSKSFMKLMTIEWALKVTKLAKVTLEIRSFNKEKSLPDPLDIQNLQAKIREDIKAFNDKDKSPMNFRAAAQAAQARLLLYNKRRSGEIEGIR